MSNKDNKEDKKETQQPVDQPVSKAKPATEDTDVTSPELQPHYADDYENQKKSTDETNAFTRSKGIDIEDVNDINSRDALELDAIMDRKHQESKENTENEDEEPKDDSDKEEAKEEEESKLEYDKDAQRIDKYQNVIVTKQWGSEIPPKIKNVGTIALPAYLPSVSGELYFENMKAISAAKEDTASESKKKWLETLREAETFNSTGDGDLEILENPEAEFRQQLNNPEGEPVAGKYIHLKSRAGEVMEGEAAVARVRARRGKGSPFEVSLFHSGIKLILSAPSDTDIVTFNENLLRDKKKMGRDVTGHLFSAENVFHMDRIINFILDHVVRTNVKLDMADMRSLRSHISVLDIPTLMWAMACCEYNHGFKYVRSCMSRKGDCTFTTEELLDLSSLCFIDNNKFTDVQTRFMALPMSQTHTLDEVKAYQRTLGCAQRSVYEEDTGDEDTIRVTVVAPTIEKHIKEGFAWCAEVEELTNKIAITELEHQDSEEEIDNIINNFQTTTYLRRYASWIEKIEASGGTVVDTPTINSILSDCSRDEVIAEVTTKTVKDAIIAHTMVVIGLPEFDCPKCEEHQNPVNPVDGFSNIIPLDVLAVFINLTMQKMSFN